MEATRVLIKVVCLIVVCDRSVHVIGASYTSKYKRNVDLDGKICPAGDVIFVSQNCVNAKKCTIQCNSRSNCASVSYQPELHTCTLCDVIDDVMEELAGSLFYERERGLGSILRVQNGIEAAEWGNVEFCPGYTFAAGYDMQVEGDQAEYDDTALNSIKLICKSLDGTSYGRSITSKEGWIGQWLGQVECDSSDGGQTFLSSFALQVEPYIEDDTSDNSAVKYIKLWCRDKAGTQAQKGLPIPAGVWGPSSEECPPGSVVCGLRTRVQDEQGVGFSNGNDDMSLVDVELYCCL